VSDLDTSDRVLAARVHLDPAEVMTAILKIDPAALTAGADLPATRATRPFADTDSDAFYRLPRSNTTNRAIPGTESDR
jgi:hypothetical protein